MIAATAGAQTSSDWPTFRGPNRDGISKETGLLKEWPEGGPKLLWTAKGIGKGYSNVTIVGKRIFTMGDLAEADGSQKQYIIALDLATQKRLWTALVGPPHIDGYGGPRCAPTISGDSAYAIGTGGDLVCVEIATGKERWRKNLQSDLGGGMMSGWKWAESPLVDGNKVVCTPGGADSLLAALDKTTGAVIWKTSASNLGSRGKDGSGYSSIVPATINGVKQYVQMVGRGLVGVDAATGKLLWSYIAPPTTWRTSARLPSKVTSYSDLQLTTREVAPRKSPQTGRSKFTSSRQTTLPATMAALS